jgi:hypothetical protein
MNEQIKTGDYLEVVLCNLSVAYGQVGLTYMCQNGASSWRTPIISDNPDLEGLAWFNGYPPTSIAKYRIIDEMEYILLTS